MASMIKKIIYSISIISLVLLTILTVEMLPLIFQSNWQGIIYLISVILILLFELFMLFSNKKALKKCVSYNIFIILVTMYVSIVYYKIFSTSLNSLFIYDIDISYCKDNYLLLSLALSLIIFNLILLIFDTKKKEIL